MDPLTITTASVLVQEAVSGAAVSGTVLPDGTTATFTPLSSLALNTGYIITVTTGARDLAGNALANDKTFTFATSAAVLAPTVTSSVPANGDTGVQINRRVTGTFSELMDPATIVSPATSFSVKEAVSGNSVAGTVTFAGKTAVFTPASALTGSTQYTATLSTLVKSQAGIALAANHVWNFNTGLTADSTAPTLISTGASDGDTGLPINRNLTATFSEPMDAATLASPAASFTLKEFVSGNSVAGATTYLGNTATFNPTSELLPNTKYEAAITTAARDLAGNALVPGLRANPWTWTTGSAPDTIAPTVTATSPADLATNVAIDKKINATFSEAMDPGTMITANVTVKETASGNTVNGTVAYDTQNSIATLSPASDLLPDTDYTATISAGAKDLAGNILIVPAGPGLAPNPWTFRTAPTPVPPPSLAVNLRGAATFGIASRAGLTSTGVTVVNGDVALHPLAACTDSTGNAGASQTCLVKIYTSPTGMTVNGSIYFAGDPFDNGGTANSVTNDLNIAWTEARNKADTFIAGTIAGEQLDGKTLAPGVYHEANLGLAAGGLVILDAQNDANAIFIFKVDSTFVDSGTLLLPSEVRLANGAQARNVWFVTGLDITIGSGTTWNGNILAGRDATILDGSTVNGRVLGGASGAGAIVLTGAASPSVTTITVPE
jgi:methionine-rich copper-binding protein CopC